MSDADITARMRLDAKQFRGELDKSLDHAEKQAAKASTQINAAFGKVKALAGGFGVGFIATELLQASRAAAEFADDLSASADQAGISVERYQTVRQGLRSLEVGFEQTDKILKALNDTVGSVQLGTLADQQSEALDRMGVRQRLLNGEIETADQLLDAIAGSTSRYATEAQFTSDVVALLGRKIGVDLSAALKDGGDALHDFEKNLRASGDVIDEQMIQKLADANEKIDAFQQRAKTRFTIFEAETIDVFQQVGNAIDDYLGKLKYVSPAATVLGLGAQTKGERDKDALRAEQASLKAMETTLARLSRGTAIYAEQLAEVNAQRAKLGLKPAAGDLPPSGPVLDPIVVTATDPDAARRAAEAKRKADEFAREKRQREETYQRDQRQNEAELRFLQLKLQGKDGEAELEERLFRLRESNAGLSKDQLAVLERQTTEIVSQEQALDAQKASRDQAKRDEEERAQKAKEVEEEQKRIAKQNIYYLSDIWYDAFTGGAGSIWKRFKYEGLRAISDLSAQMTLQLLSGGGSGTGLGGLSAGIGGGNGGLIGALLGSGGGGQDSPGYAGGTIRWQNGGILGQLFGANSASAGGTAAADAGALGGASSVLGPLALSAGIGATFKGVPGLLGMKTSTTGGVAGGVIGGALAGPIGAVVGSILGSFIGGLFKKTKTGTATLGLTGGQLGVTGTSGNNGARREAASSLGGSVADDLNRIAEALGGTLSGSISTSIGIRKDSFRVDTLGLGRTKGSGVLDFGKDEEAAIRAAIGDALRDGVIGGISDASKRILASGKDLEKAIEQASLIESIPKRLKQIEDPLGAALDDLAREFEAVKKALDAGQASAQQYADAEKLFNLEREKIVESTEGGAAALKQFADGLKLGSNSPLSLRDQETAARLALKPFEDRILTGQSIDQEKFTEAAQALLDVSRGLNGSTEGFFADFSRINELTAAAIQRVENATPLRDNVNPFTQAAVDAAARTATNTQTMTDILSQHTQLLTQIAATMGGGQAAAGGAGARYGFVKVF